MLERFTDPRGYIVRGTDGEVGKAHEFILDDHDWSIRYIVIDTTGWLSGEKVLLSTDYLCAPDWRRRVLGISLSRQQVLSSLARISGPQPSLEPIEMASCPLWGSGAQEDSEIQGEHAREAEPEERMPETIGVLH
ncbi:MAG: PRC-barrel domain-containing protein [Anaerolineae bacterium]